MFDIRSIFALGMNEVNAWTTWGPPDPMIGDSISTLNCTAKPVWACLGVNPLGMARNKLLGVLFCSVLFCSVLFCSVLFCSVLFCSVLFCSVLFCSVLFCSVLFCSALFRSDLFGSALLCAALLCYRWSQHAQWAIRGIITHTSW